MAYGMGSDRRHRFPLVVLSALTLGTLATPGCDATGSSGATAEATETVDQAREALVAGKVPSEEQRLGTVLVAALRPDTRSDAGSDGRGTLIAYCSGVAVSARLVLTAADCLQGPKERAAPHNVSVFFGTSLQESLDHGYRRVAQQLFIKPRKLEPEYANHDFEDPNATAAILLEEPMDGDVVHPVAPMPPTHGAWNPSEMLKHQITAASYIATGTDGKRIAPPRYELRQTDGLIEGLDTDPNRRHGNYIGFRSVDAFSEQDAGSPVYIRKPNAAGETQWYLLGIVLDTGSYAGQDNVFGRRDGTGTHVGAQAAPNFPPWLLDVIRTEATSASLSTARGPAAAGGSPESATATSTLSGAADPSGDGAEQGDGASTGGGCSVLSASSSRWDGGATLAGSVGLALAFSLLRRHRCRPGEAHQA